MALLCFAGSVVMPVEPDEPPVEPDEPLVEPDVPLVLPPHGPGVLAGCPEMMQVSRSSFSPAKYAWTSIGVPISVPGVSTDAGDRKSVV